MLMIRFQRIGRRNDPAFRIVVVEKTASPTVGTYADQVGTYNPRTKALSVDMERITGWMAKGAQLSPSLHNLLVREGKLEGKKIAVVSKKNLEKNLKKEEPAAAVAVAEEASTPAEAAPVEAAVAPAPAEKEAPVETPAAA